ncbi:ATP-binding cassette domain-containing protein [Globicatella sulfidifaciens]|uniref:ATP-binding cassette domain-containing protein n=1 Tax=Globicatella sulfidifaciens TaxID=136093 RepID=UPI00117A4279|nr:ABC transporter ATP-binding protein [Globicatella sulfidifaciens]
MIGDRQVLNGSITVGALASIIALSNELEMPVNLIADNLSSINSVKDIKQKYDAKGERAADDAPITTHIESLQQIDIQTLAYSINHQNFFEDFNYQFEQGKKYLIVGSSGKGKSTLAYLITKNLDPDQGTILYNHMDHQQVSYQEVQDHIGLISQHSIIFADTVLNNLHLYQELPIEMTQQLLEQFGLDERFNDWNELIIEEGNLSGGQKQRMIIIRALLQNKKFIILDESLSALDKENFHRIEDYLLDQEDI